MQFQYAQPVPDRGDPFSWKRLAISPDREGPGVCAINCMRAHLRLNVWACWDWSHDVHNDFELALDAAKLHYWMMHVVLVANDPCLDWGSGHRWRQVKAVMDAYFAVQNPHAVPLFVSMAGQIMDTMPDAGEVMASEDPTMELWQRTRSSCPWNNKGEKLKLSRFLGPLQRVRREVANAPLLQLSYTATCLQLDTLHGAGFLRRHLRGMSSVPGSTGHPTSDRANQDDRALRNCGNALTVACMFWSASLNVRRLQVVSTVGDALLAWQSQQSKDLREAGEVPKFMFLQCGGLFMQSLSKVVRALATEE